MAEFEDKKTVKAVEVKVEDKKAFLPELKDGNIRFEKITNGQYDYIDFPATVDEITKKGLIDAGFTQTGEIKKKEA